LARTGGFGKPKQGRKSISKKAGVRPRELWGWAARPIRAKCSFRCAERGETGDGARGFESKTFWMGKLAGGPRPSSKTGRMGGGGPRPGRRFLAPPNCPRAVGTGDSNKLLLGDERCGPDSAPGGTAVLPVREKNRTTPPICGSKALGERAKKPPKKKNGYKFLSGVET